MAITIKEIHVRTNIVKTEKKDPKITTDMLQEIKEEILRELRKEPYLAPTKRER